MPIAKYSFKRPRGRLGQEAASTDAKSALHVWMLLSDDVRAYDVLTDTEHELVAELSFEDADSAAILDLESSCDKHAVERMAL